MQHARNFRDAVKFVKIGSAEESISCWVTRNIALVNAVEFPAFEDATFTDRLYLLNVRDSAGHVKTSTS